MLTVRDAGRALRGHSPAGAGRLPARQLRAWRSRSPRPTAVGSTPTPCAWRPNSSRCRGGSSGSPTIRRCSSTAPTTPTRRGPWPATLGHGHGGTPAGGGRLDPRRQGRRRDAGALLPACRAAVFTKSSNPRALSPATLESLARQLGRRDCEIEAEPRRCAGARDRVGRARRSGAGRRLHISALRPCRRPAPRPASSVPEAAMGEHLRMLALVAIAGGGRDPGLHRRRLRAGKAAALDGPRTRFRAPLGYTRAVARRVGL